jgi:hypothetical protein
MPETGRPPALKTQAYYLEESQVEWVKAIGLEQGISASDVMRAILRGYGPLYEEDVREQQRRIAARQAV